MTFELRGQKAKPEALVEGWPQDYWEDFKHPTRQAQLDLALADPWKRVKAWMAGEAREQPGFIFYGPPGYGKTATALKLLLLLSRHGYLTRFVTAEHLAAERESTTYSFKDGKTPKALLEEVLAPEALLIDDVGAREYSPTVRALLFDAVRERLSKGHQTFMTTNLDLRPGTGGQEQFSRSLDARVLSTYTGYAYYAGAWAHDVAEGAGSLRAKVKP